MRFNPDIHHRQSIRLKNYDYSQAGCYFITICAKDRQNIFGEFVGAGLASAPNNQPSAPNNQNQPHPTKNKIILSPIGQIIDNQLNNIPNQYDHVELDQHIIMPNHLHLILIVNFLERADFDSGF